MNIPIIMVSAKGDEFDKILALEIGADDYVSKPFSPRELLARIKAVLRRVSGPRLPSQEGDHEVLSYGELTIDHQRYEATLKQFPLFLTKTEFELLITMARKPDRVFTRDQLLYQVWGNDFYGDNRVVDVHIRRLRSKIEQHSEKEYVRTVRGVGYKFSK
jgi:two-component system alkaline phosphatase synthesis response regulator PhoP